MDIRCCIFDLDGVIVDTARFHFLAWRRLANKLGFDFSEKQNEQLKGVSRRGSLETILRWGGIEMEEAEFGQWMTQKNDWYLEMVDTLDPADIFPGASEFILHLRNIGIRVALGSASKNASTILSKLEIQDLFDCIVDGNSVKRGKPAPDTFLKAIEDTNINPEEAIVFEDSVSGIEAALIGGFYAVGVGDPDALQKAHVIIPGFEKIDLSELIIDLIESRRNK